MSVGFIQSRGPDTGKETILGDLTSTVQALQAELVDIVRVDRVAQAGQELRTTWWLDRSVDCVGGRRLRQCLRWLPSE